jgi:AcrR family transcriptional regulator
MRSPARHEMVMNRLMEAAEQLFARKGVAGTSLQELAEAVGLTRTGIYHYIRNKDELLDTLVKGFTLPTSQDVQRLAQPDSRPAIDRLREAVTNMALIVALHPQRFRLLLTSEGALPEPLAEQHLQARRQTLASLKDLISQAIKEGSCRPVDAELAAFSLLGVSNWVAFWYPRHSGAGAATPELLAAGLTDIALGGLVAKRAPSGTEGIPYMVGLLREDLDRLETMIKSE